MTALTKVICAFVYDDGPADDGVTACETDGGVADGEIGHSGRIRRHVTQVPHVPDGVSRPSVRLGLRVEVSSSTDTAVCVVPKLVDVEAVLPGRQAGDTSLHRHGAATPLLHELDGSLDGAAAGHNAHRLDRHGGGGSWRGGTEG